MNKHTTKYYYKRYYEKIGIKSNIKADYAKKKIYSFTKIFIKEYIRNIEYVLLCSRIIPLA